MILFHKAGKSFGNAVALRPTDLKIPANKTTVLIGLSGSGKSTILRLISGLIEPTTGWIEIDGKKTNPGHALGASPANGLRDSER